MLPQLTHIPAPWSPHVIKERDYIFKDRLFVTLAATQVQRQKDYSGLSMFKSLHTGPVLDLSYMWWRTTICPEDSANRQLTAESLRTRVFAPNKIYTDRVKTVASRLRLWAELWNVVIYVNIQLEEPAPKLVPAQRKHQKGRRGAEQFALGSFNGNILTFTLEISQHDPASSYFCTFSLPCRIYLMAEKTMSVRERRVRPITAPTLERPNCITASEYEPSVSAQVTSQSWASSALSALSQCRHSVGWKPHLLRPG